MKLQNRLRHIFLFLVLFISSMAFCAAQNMGRIAILSFNGGSQDERAGIAELFSFTPQIMRNFTVIPRTTITRAIEREQNFQLSSGMTDADTMVRLGYQFGANYVMAGSITSLGRSRLLIVSIVKIDVIQQVAGAFLEYKSLDDFNKDETIIEKMTTELVSLMRNDTSKMDKLAVLPVQFLDGANEQDGDALAQVLSIYLIQNGKYAVYPRTKTLEQVQDEYTIQLSGRTRESEAVSLGRGINPQYVLSIASRRIGTANRFNAAVIDLEGGNQVAGESEQYATLSDGINAMEFLAKRLSGIQVSERERNRRLASVASTVDAEEKAKQRQEAIDKFLGNSGINLSGWLGFINYKWPDGIYNNVLAGGGEIGLCLSPYFTLQTGLEAFQDREYRPEGRERDKSNKSIITQTAVQIPVLARFDIPILYYYYISPYAGIGLNVASIGKDVTIQSYSPVSFIVGGELGMSLYGVKFFAAYQYNRDLSDTVYIYKDQKFSYLGARSIWYFGIKMFIPFKK